MSSDLKNQVYLIVESLSRQGWKCYINGGTHWRLAPPDKKTPVQFISYTPSDTRALKNIRSQLRRAGAKLD